MLKWLLRILLISVLCTVAALAWIVGTASGTRWTLLQVESRVDALEMDGISGRLFDDLSINKIEYNNAGTVLKAEQFSATWNVRCLLQKKLCINDIHVVSVDAALPPSTAETVDSQPTPFSIPALPIAIVLDQARIDTFNWTQAVTTQTIRNINLSMTVDDKSIDVQQAALTWQDNALSLDGALQLDANYPLEANLLVKLPSLLGPKPTQLNLQANGLLGDALEITASLDGHQQAKLRGSIHALESPLRLEGVLNGALLQTLEVESQTAKINGLVVNFSGDLNTLKLNTSASISGLNVPDTVLKSTAELTNLSKLNDFQLALDTLDGSAELNGQVEWSENLQWNLNGRLNELDISQYRDDLSGKISGTLNSSGSQYQGVFNTPKTTLALNGSFQERPLSADVDFSISRQGHVELKKAQLQSGSNRFSATGSIDQQLDLDAQITAPELDSLWPGLGGKLHGTLNASGSREAPNVQADIQGDAVTFNQLLAEKVTLQAAINEGGKSDSSVSLKLIGAQNHGLAPLANIDTELKGTRAQHQLNIQAASSEQSAQLSANGTVVQGGWQGALQSVQLQHKQQNIQLNQATALSWKTASAQLSIAAHCWLWEQSRVCLDEDTQLSATDGKASVSLSKTDLSTLKPWLPEDVGLDGTLAATIKGQWVDGNRPTVSLESNAQQLALNTINAKDEAATLNFGTVDFTGQLGQTTDYLNLELRSEEHGIGSIYANIDPKTKALSGQVDIQQFLLEPLLPLIPMLDTLRGKISATGAFGGTLDDPQFVGKIKLSDPAIAGVQFPLTIDGGALTVDLDGREAVLDAKFAVEPSGTLALNGNASFSDTLRADIQLTGDALALSVPPSIDATINHALNIAYTPEVLQLRGAVHVMDANVVLDELSGGGPAVSSDMVFTDAEDQQSEQAEQMGGLPVDIDVQVQVDEDVRLSGYGLDTRLVGNIKVRQRAGQPAQLAGELALQDGKYQAYGQDLEVRRGELLFVGPVQSTRVDVSAVRVVDDVEAGITLTGSLLAPETALFSEPAMADADVLSYILIGGPPGQGGDESAMLARAALGLGLKNGNRIAGQFASAAGIQDFNIGADGSGENTAVVVSGRLSPKVLLSYRMGIFEAANALTARYDINRSLYLELMRGVEQAIDLFYTIDY